MSKFETSAGIKIPAMKGQQGGRVMYLCLTRNAVLNNFFPKEAEVPETPKAQRPYDPARAQQIADYMVRDREGFVLGTLTYAMSMPGSFEPAEDGASIGMLHIPLEATLRCVDGQHRRGAIRHAMEALEELRDDDTALLIYVEEELDARRQMFSDMNWHQRPVSKSINVGFDQRDPFARATQRLAANHPLLKGRVEEDRSSVRGNSENIYTLGAVYDALGRLFTGAGGRLRDKDKYGTEDDLYAAGNEFFTWLLNARDELQTVQKKPGETPDMRVKTILLSSTTLKMLASAVYILRQQAPGAKLGSYTKKLADIDFGPKATIWKKAGFVSPGKSTPNARLQEIQAAAHAVAEVLGA